MLKGFYHERKEELSIGSPACDFLYFCNSDSCQQLLQKRIYEHQRYELHGFCFMERNRQSIGSGFLYVERSNNAAVQIWIKEIYQKGSEDVCRCFGLESFLLYMEQTVYE